MEIKTETVLSKLVIERSRKFALDILFDLSHEGTNNIVLTDQYFGCMRKRGFDRGIARNVLWHLGTGVNDDLNIIVDNVDFKK